MKRTSNSLLSEFIEEKRLMDWFALNKIRVILLQYFTP